MSPIETLFNLIPAFLLSWQVKTLLGLIVLDVLLGVASALRRGRFDWALLATFYVRSVVPYLIGYLAFYVTVGFVIPPEILGDLGGPVNQAVITLAWAAITGTLVQSIAFNFREMYQGQ